MGLKDLKKELNKLDKDQIIELVADLYQKNKSAKEFLDFYVTPNEQELFEKYRAKVYEAFYPKRGFGYKLIDGKKAISEFKKLGTSSALVAELTLFYVETGVAFINEFGDMEEGYYNSMETTFKNALTLMKKENLLDKFKEQLVKLIFDARNIGWGLQDYFKYIYFENYGEYLYN